MGPVWNVDRDFYEGVYDGLLHYFTTRGVFKTRQLLSRDDLFEHVR
jgi:hypothetical protein